MKKNFEGDYNRLVKNKLSGADKKNAMEQSIGGNFHHFGILQRELIRQQGLKGDDVILDVGCGSGRLANALKEMPNLTYIGIDVVQDLLDYADEICQRDDWSFIKATDLKIPLDDNSVDIITCFSVFTHLLHEETYVYLAEMRRVLKPGGKIVFSFLDFLIPEHWGVFASNLILINDQVPLNQFIDPQAIRIWSQHLRLEVENIFSGNSPYIHMSEAIEGENGELYQGMVTLGQSVCVLRKLESSHETIHAILPTNFNVQKYLELNPDLEDSGVDPEVHYITCGQFENRQYN
ncbi:MAG: class I SAM-dependent methyltransferase [Methylococcales bacterium]|nr:class I SAM-dependent methyltransferase [Methylococcales bacterium]